MTAATTLDEVVASEDALRRFLRQLPPVDDVGLSRQVRRLATRELRGAARHAALTTAITMVDLTTLEGADTPARVRQLCARARLPDPTDPTVPPVAAVCVYPDLVATAVDALAGSGVTVASVATAFPSGRTSRPVKLTDTGDALAAGAGEVDVVVDRGAVLAGRWGDVLDELRALVALCHAHGAHCKVILETGELGDHDTVRRAAWTALLAGADVVKTSTGKVSPGATRPATTVLLQAVRDFHALTGERRGVKAAGGIRTAEEALAYLVLVAEVAGPAWLHASLFRFGASSLLDDLVRARHAAPLPATLGGA